MPSSGIYGTNPVFGATADAQIVSDGKNGTPRIADETRRKILPLLIVRRPRPERINLPVTGSPLSTMARNDGQIYAFQA